MTAIAAVEELCIIEPLAADCTKKMHAPATEYSRLRKDLAYWGATAAANHTTGR